MRKNFALSALSLALLLPSLARAEVKIETVEYKDGDTICEGAVAFDAPRRGRRPEPAVGCRKR